MTDIAFQNGFVCGMATKGLVRSGEFYRPIIWNDSGETTFFYIDFRRAMRPFSIGMWNESIIVHDSAQLPVTDIKFVSTGIYKIYCDISNRVHGITVVNKITSLLRFSNNERLYVFSIHMFVTGIAQYITAGYMYESVVFATLIGAAQESGILIGLATTIIVPNIYDSIIFADPIFGSITEAQSITLTSL